MSKYIPRENYMDIDSALDAFYRSKYKEKVNKILLTEQPDREEDEDSELEE